MTYKWGIIKLILLQFYLTELINEVISIKVRALLKSSNERHVVQRHIVSWEPWLDRC